MFFRESERRSKGMWIYSVRRITEGAWMESFCEWSMWPLCSSARATPLKIITTARLSVHTLMGSKEVLRTKTLPFISADITRARKRVSKLVVVVPGFLRAARDSTVGVALCGHPSVGVLRWGGHGGPPLQLRSRDR